MSVLGTNITLVFSRAPGWTELLYLRIGPLPAITASTDVPDLTGRKPGSIYPEASTLSGDGTGILTSFPFDSLELRRVLGSANPRLTNSAEEPLPFRPSGFSPDFRCYYDQDFRHQSVHRNSHPCFHPIGAPTYVITV